MLPPPLTATLTPKVLDLCKEIVSNPDPTILPVEAQSFSMEKMCFPNVIRMIEQYGGSMLCGWQLWETLPGLMIEAEFHAVWLDVNGGIHDITPKRGIKKILFLPDLKRKYEGRQVDNVRWPLLNDNLITEYIHNASALFEATNRGNLANEEFFTLTPEISSLVWKSQYLLDQIERKFYTPKYTT